MSRVNTSQYFSFNYSYYSQNMILTKDNQLQLLIYICKCHLFKNQIVVQMNHELEEIPLHNAYLPLGSKPIKTFK